MARLPRYAAPGVPHHVIQRGNNRSAMFVGDLDFRFFRQCLEDACDRQECRVHAYVLMTNHVHLLVTPAHAGAIGRVLQLVGSRYVQRFNARYRRTGTLWEGRYRATLVHGERYLLTCYRYIELNPVRAGLVADPRAYKWSSYRANARGADDPLVTPHERYLALGADARARRRAYRALFSDEIPETTLSAVRRATHKGWALGDRSFGDQIAPLVGRPASPRPPGPRQRE